MGKAQSYQIIPRKFRPKTFSEVAGHEAIVTTLKNALHHQKLGQAYLFCGTRGCGKTTLARLFAKALNCSELGEDKEPCNTCTSCLEITEGRSLDIIEIDGASNRGIDDIRNLTETVGYAPQSGQFKIYIIDEVHMLTKEAFNALLKTLEEPPERVKFFFATTEPHRVPPTIISRCQRFNLARIPEKELVEKLMRIAKELEIEVEEKALIQIGKLAEGSLRDAESLLDQLICFGQAPITWQLTRDLFGLISHSHLEEIDQAIASSNLDRAAEIGRKLYESGRDIGACIDSLLEHFRDHLLSEDHFDKQQCHQILETLITWQQQMLKTPFKQVHLEMLLCALVKSSRRISLDHLIERLLNLEMAAPQEVMEPKPIAAFQKAPVAKQAKREEAASVPSQKELTLAQQIKEQHPVSKYETLIRFAAVELEGSIKNG